jgi:hypothetical protein
MIATLLTEKKTQNSTVNEAVMIACLAAPAKVNPNVAEIPQSRRTMGVSPSVDGFRVPFTSRLLISRQSIRTAESITVGFSVWSSRSA